MPNPEIARRCRACGASVRAGVQFCTQCGQAMVRSVVSVHSIPDPPETPGRARVNADEARRTDAAAQRKIEPPSAAGPAVSAGAARAPDPASPARATARDERATSGTNARTENPAGGGRRVGRQPLYAENEDNGLLPRVEKFRQASVDMLDEAAEDPSLRFVLVSVMLFLCFLLIFLASTVFN